MQLLKFNKKTLESTMFDSSLFRIAYIVDLFLGMLAFLEGVSLILKCFILVWAVFIFFNNFIRTKNITKIKYYKILLIFVVSCLITTFIYFQDNLLPNLLAVYHMLICFSVFYGMYKEKDRDSIKKEMKLIFTFIVIATSILSVIGFLIFILKIQINIGEHWLGIYQNRFIGVYINSNLLALSCVLSIIFSHMLMNSNILGSKKPKTNTRRLHIFSIVINLCALILSDSNASFLFLIIYFIVVLFYNLFSNETVFSTTNLIKKGSLLIFFCITIAFSSFGIRDICQDKAAEFVNDLHQSQEPVHDNKNEGDNILENTEQTESVSIGRDPLTGNYDVSSGRFTLLKQSFVMFENHPVWGIGRGNIVEYGQKEIPGGLRFSDFHNGYITILVSWGLVGFCIFSLFVVLVATYMCRNLFYKKQNKDANIYASLFAIVVSYGIYSLFEKTLLSEITFMVVIFWLILGYSMGYINEENKGKQRGRYYDRKPIY